MDCTFTLKAVKHGFDFCFPQNFIEFNQIGLVERNHPDQISLLLLNSTSFWTQPIRQPAINKTGPNTIASEVGYSCHQSLFVLMGRTRARN